MTIDTGPDKIVRLDRKPFVAQVAAAEDAPEAVKIDESALKVAERLVEQIKAGEMRCLAFIALSGEGSPISTMPVHDDITFIDLALLNIAAESLKEQVSDCIYSNSTRFGVTPNGGHVEIEDGDDPEDVGA